MLLDDDYFGADVVVKRLFFRREMLATHLLTHIFQHTLFDWLKFTWSHQILWVPYEFGGSPMNFNQSKRVC